MDNGDEAALSQNDVGFVESTPVLPEFLTGKEYIRFLLDIQKMEEEVSADELFSFVDLDGEDQNKLIKAYSHGMKNKLQMLSLLICNPPVLFLDEPLTSLDVVVASEMKRIISEMKKDHVIIFSTHILQLAADLCDELLVLNNKKLTHVSSEMLSDKNFEKKIVALLKNEDEYE